MKFGIIANIRKETVAEAILQLLESASKYPIDFLFHSDLSKILKKKGAGKKIAKENFLNAEKLVQESDMIVAYGGDGTILQASRLIGRASVPILGINLGKLGFLAELSVDEMESFLADIINHQYVIEERSVVKVSIEGEDGDLFGLNDVVVDKSSSSRVITMTVHVNNDLLIQFAGDGLIVSTPTGTTGYALAAGGPIVVPTTQVMTLQPISAHTLTARSVIVPDNSVIRVTVEKSSEQARVTVDGQQDKICKPPVEIIIQKADYAVKLVKRKDRSYCDVLRAKLMWGQDIRMMKEQ